MLSSECKHPRTSLIHGFQRKSLPPLHIHSLTLVVNMTSANDSLVSTYDVLVVVKLEKFFSFRNFYFIFICWIPFAGESFKQVRIGQLVTQVGTLTMAVAYRTKMTISPTQTGRDNAIMLKSDHFLKDLSPKHLRYANYNKKKWVKSE